MGDRRAIKSKPFRKMRLARPKPEVILHVFTSMADGTFSKTADLLGMSEQTVRRNLEKHYPSVVEDQRRTWRSKQEYDEKLKSKLLCYMRRGMDLGGAVATYNENNPERQVDYGYSRRLTLPFRKESNASTKYPGVTVFTERIVDMYMAGMTMEQIALAVQLSGKGSVSHHVHHTKLPENIRRRTKAEAESRIKTTTSLMMKNKDKSSDSIKIGDKSEAAANFILNVACPPECNVFPVSGNHSWDFVIQKGDRLLKIQVRTVSKNNQVPLRHGSKGYSKYNSNNCNILLACTSETYSVRFFSGVNIWGKGSVSFSKGVDVSARDFSKLSKLIEELFHSENTDK